MVQSSDTGATLMSAATGPDVSGAPPNGNDRSAMHLTQPLHKALRERPRALATVCGARRHEARRRTARPVGEGRCDAS